MAIFTIIDNIIIQLRLDPSDCSEESLYILSVNISQIGTQQATQNNYKSYSPTIGKYCMLLDACVNLLFES